MTDYVTFDQIWLDLHRLSNLDMHQIALSFQARDNALIDKAYQALSDIFTLAVEAQRNPRWPKNAQVTIEQIINRLIEAQKDTEKA